MSDCTRLSDRMPAVARGNARWSATEEAHLASCADCAFEWSLIGQVSGLGRSLPEPDTARLARAVLAVLRTPAPRQPARVERWVIPAALAAGLLLVLTLPRSGELPDASEAVALSLLPEVETLSDTELESVIRLIPATDPANLGGVDSLTEDELTQMLKDLEG